MKLLTPALAAVLAALTLAGCDSAPDRRAEATVLESVLARMPGVATASTSYENGASRGASVLVDVSMPRASDAQIVDMVRQMNTTMGDDFDAFYLPITVTLGGGVRLTSIGKMDPESTARDVAIARPLEKGVQAQSVTIAQISAGPRVDIQNATDSLSAVTAAIRAVGPVTAGVEVYPVGSGDQRIWDVATPLSVERMRAITADVDGLPAHAYLIAVRAGQVSRLSVYVDASQSGALGTLRSVVGRVGAGPGHPLVLEWTTRDATGGGDKRTAGSVTVGACTYTKSAGEQDPQRFSTDAALSVQRQMRSEFDTCPR